MAERSVPRQDWRNKDRSKVVSQDFRQHKIPDDEFEALFNVKKTFSKGPSWILPDLSKAFSQPSYEFEDLQKIMEDAIAETPIIIGNYTWEDWREICDNSGLGPYVVRVLKRHYKFGMIVRNWAKAYEIYSTYPVVTSGHLNSVHIGDEHGGLILALNHYLHSKFEDVKWNWRATCENPYYEDAFAADR